MEDDIHLNEPIQEEEYRKHFGDWKPEIDNNLNK